MLSTKAVHQHHINCLILKTLQIFENVVCVVLKVYMNISLHAGKLFMIFVVCCFFVCFFSKITFTKNSFTKTIKVSNRLDPDQDRHSVGPDLGPNCLQGLSADDTSTSRQRV